MPRMRTAKARCACYAASAPYLSLRSSLTSRTFSARDKTKAKQTQESCSDAVVSIYRGYNFYSTFTMIK